MSNQVQFSSTTVRKYTIFDDDDQEDVDGNNNGALEHTHEAITSTVTTAPQKKVEFSPQVQMESFKGTEEGGPKSGSDTQGGSTNTQQQPQAPTAPSASVLSRRRSSPTGNLFQEIRKMSLASQDAKEEKKSSKKLSLKKLFGRRKKRREEEYTDKDRAAAVTLGSRDIKLSLKAKKKRERKLCISIELMNSEDFLTEMLMQEAILQIRLKKTHEAIETLNKALELHPNHRGALVARSQCYLKLGNATLALRDAEMSFDNDEKTFVSGLLQYAESLYSLGRFEQALIAYHRGLRLRRDMEEFRIGVQKCQDAIKRAIGNSSKTKISNLDDIMPVIDKMKPLRNNEMETHEEDLKVYFGDKLKPESKSQSNWIAREVLGQIYFDKDYFTKFLKRSAIQKDQDTAHELRSNANEALNYLQVREKFWRQQNPMYARNVPITSKKLVDKKK